MANNLKLDPFDMILFGATGDLAMRKLVRALFRRAAAGQIPAGSKIIGVARSDLTSEQYLGEARMALEKYLNPGELTPEKWDVFAGLVTYVHRSVVQEQVRQPIPTGDRELGQERARGTVRTKRPGRRPDPDRLAAELRDWLRDRLVHGA